MPALVPNPGKVVFAVLAVIALACAVLMVVVSPSRAVPADVPNPGNDVFAVLAVMALACDVLIVVVSPAKAVVLDVPNCNSAVSPSNAVPALVPKPGKVVFAVLAVIAFACAVLIVVVSPASAVVLVVPNSKRFVSPSSAVPADVPNPGNDVFAVFATTAESLAMSDVKANVPVDAGTVKRVLPEFVFRNLANALLLPSIAKAAPCLITRFASLAVVVPSK